MTQDLTCSVQQRACCHFEHKPLDAWAAGDLPLMWIRDSAVQINVLLPRIRKRPALRRPIEGAIRAQAFYILQVWRGDGTGMLQWIGMGLLLGL